MYDSRSRRQAQIINCETKTITKAKTTAPKTSQDKRKQKPKRIKYNKGEQVGKGVDQFKRIIWKRKIPIATYLS